MTETAIALYQFWSGFGLPAYPEDNVPDNAVLPYITYRLASPNWDSTMSSYARVWYKDKSYVAISSKVDEIREAIGEGKSITTEHGFVMISADSNFVQFQPYESDDNIKIAYLSYIVNACN